jgi:hypothetical protein
MVLCMPSVVVARLSRWPWLSFSFCQWMHLHSVSRFLLSGRGTIDVIDSSWPAL